MSETLIFERKKRLWEERFLKKLEGVSDPEAKRKIIATMEKDLITEEEPPQANAESDATITKINNKILEIIFLDF